MAFSVNNFCNNACYLSIEIPEELALKQLIERKDQQALLHYLRICRLDIAKWRWCSPNKEEMRIIWLCIENSWDEILAWLAEKQMDFTPEIARAITDKNEQALNKLLIHYRGDINFYINGKGETLLRHALNEKNYSAANLLIEKGACLHQNMPPSLYDQIKEDFRKHFFSNKYYYGSDGESLLSSTLGSDISASLAYAIAAYYYPRDSAALDLLLNHPKYITLKVVKAFIQLGDEAAFNKVLKQYVLSDLTIGNGTDSAQVEKRKGELFQYALRDFHFSLMGFNFDYIVNRLGIIKSLLALNPTVRTLDKNMMSTYEIVQYLQFCLPEAASKEFEPLFSKLLDDPTGFHDIWSLQRLLINMLGAQLGIPGHNSLQIEIAHYPSVAKHLHDSVNLFLQQKKYNFRWVYVTPQRHFTVDKCLQWIDEKKILKVFTGWTGGCDWGHCINAVIFDKYLFICNRGRGSEPHIGVAIYEVQDKGYLKEMVQLFLERSKQTEQFITSGLLKHPQIRYLKTIDCNFQRSKNCIWLSEKMGVYACFIAAMLKEGQSLEDSMKHARILFKEWSEKDRLNLLQAYLSHPYHLQCHLDNEKEGIHFSNVIYEITHRAPRRLKSKYYDKIFKILEDDRRKKALSLDDNHYIVTSLRFQHMEIALAQGETALALSQIAKMGDVNTKNIRDETLLHLACRYNNLDVAKELIKRGAKPQKISCDKRCALQELFIKNASMQFRLEGLKKQEELIKLMVEVTPLDELAKRDVFPLHTAILQAHEYAGKYAVQQILDKGFDLLRPNSNGETGYYFAVLTKSESLSKALLSTCPDPNLPNKKGETLLQMAVRMKKLHAVQTLLDQGANPNTMNLTNKVTPLDEVTSDDHLPICKLLIEKGADINRQSYNGVSHLISQIYYLGNYAIAHEMLQHKDVDIHIKTNSGETALSLAVTNGIEEMVKILLDKGADSNTCNKNGSTPLHVAVSDNHVEICRLLLAARARKDATVKEGHWAGQTPYDLARLGNHAAILELFKEK
jgi:ankyrin repeat protein